MTDFTRYSSAFSTPGGWMDASCTRLVNFITTDARNLNTDDRVICTRLAASHIALFKHLTVHVYQNLRAERRGNERNLTKMKDYITFLFSGHWDALASLVHHKDISDFLLSFPGWNDDTQSRKLVALDIDALCINLITIIQDRDEYRALSNLEGKDAQTMLDLLQTLADSPFLDSHFRIPFVSALLRLSRKSHAVPKALVQDQVILDQGHSVAEGAFGKLYTGTHCGRAVAVKVFKASLNTGTEEHLKIISSETLIWRQLQHPNVLPFICLCYYRNEGYTEVGLVSPWIENGNVREYLRRVPSADRISLILDVLRGLEYLHSMSPIIIHGDLKAVNILVTSIGIGCLADFGLSRVLDSQIVEFSTWTVGQHGTLRWMAPELLNQDDDNEIPVNMATDMYAFGCVCYEIFSGHIPFKDVRHDLSIVPKVIAGRRPSRPVLSEPSKETCKSLGLSDSVWRIVEQCWRVDPKHRPTAEEAIQRLSTTATTLRRRSSGARVHTPASNAGENIVSWAMGHVQTRVNRRENTV